MLTHTLSITGVVWGQGQECEGDPGRTLESFYVRTYTLDVA